jgi:hypothetical protein
MVCHVRLGFYPVNPANGVFVFGTPLVRKAVLQVGGDKRFTMETVNFGEKISISKRRPSMATLYEIIYRFSADQVRRHAEILYGR